MLNDAKDLQAVYIVCGYTDLRKGIDSLLNIISQTYIVVQLSRQKSKTFIMN